MKKHVDIQSLWHYTNNHNERLAHLQYQLKGKQMTKFKAKHKTYGDCVITQFDTFSDFLEFLKSEKHIIENDEEHINTWGETFKEVASLFSENKTPVYCIDDGVNPYSFEYFEDFTKTESL